MTRLRRRLSCQQDINREHKLEPNHKVERLELRTTYNKLRHKTHTHSHLVEAGDREGFGYKMKAFADILYAAKSILSDNLKILSVNFSTRSKCRSKRETF